jgi:hypothetical protein
MNSKFWDDPYTSFPFKVRSFMGADLRGEISCQKYSNQKFFNKRANVDNL